MVGHDDHAAGRVQRLTQVGLAGRVVRKAIELGVSLDRLPAYEWKAISPLIDEDVASVFDFTASVNRRGVIGGTSNEAVKKQLEHAKRVMSNE
ncbi:MAG: hypothetical protein HGB05_07650 [Chloroflexi bacterium]|nr:hypothetical protein [Chloroflexota bacterium]